MVQVSDHGEMNMEHRQVWKNSMYEASERVPLIIAGPGVPAGAVVTNLTSLLDLYPTLMGMVGVRLFHLLLLLLILLELLLTTAAKCCC